MCRRPLAARVRRVIPAAKILEWIRQTEAVRESVAGDPESPLRSQVLARADALLATLEEMLTADGNPE